MKLTESQRERIGVLNRAGCSLRQVAEEIGCSHVTVRKALAAQPEAVAPAPAEPPTPGAPITPGAPEPEESQLDFARRCARESNALAKEARAAGNFAAAQKASRDTAQYSAIIARLEKAANEAEGGHRWTNADLARAASLTTERVKKLCERPLLCSECSRALSIVWGLGEDAASLLEGDTNAE